MTGPDLKAWRKRLGWTQQQAAEALGISVSQLADYESGSKRGTDRAAPIPRVVSLACAALEAGLTAIPDPYAWQNELRYYPPIPEGGVCPECGGAMHHSTTCTGGYPQRQQPQLKR